MWDGELPTPCTQPPSITLAARLQVDRHKSTEDEGCPAQMFPVGIMTKTRDRWKILSVTVLQPPCHSTSLPMDASRGLLCTPCPHSSCAEALVAVGASPAASSPVAGLLFVFPRIQEVISRCPYFYNGPQAIFYCPSDCC